MAKVLRCEDFMVKYPYAVQGATEEELLREATTHLAEVHHITELTQPPASPRRSSATSGPSSCRWQVTPGSAPLAWGRHAT